MTRVLIVLTSHTRLGDTGRETGFYFDEMATPYWSLIDAGHQVEIASIAGGVVPFDPSSLNDDVTKRPDPVARFLGDDSAMHMLNNTIAISDVDPARYRAVFLPGGHGTMYDFPNNADLALVVSKIYAAHGIVGAVCHGPAGLVGATVADGVPLVNGLRVNSFTDTEEAAVELTNDMPFLLESRLRDLGGRFQKSDDFQSHAVRDGRLVTGQNPASALAASQLFLDAIDDLVSET